jgi:hypothetical protein
MTPIIEMDLHRTYSQEEMKYRLFRMVNEMEIHDLYLCEFPTAVDDPEWKVYYQRLTNFNADDWLFLHQLKCELGK